jgi:hypothetical protein
MVGRWSASGLFFESLYLFVLRRPQLRGGAERVVRCCELVVCLGGQRGECPPGDGPESLDARRTAVKEAPAACRLGRCLRPPCPGCRVARILVRLDGGSECLRLPFAVIRAGYRAVQHMPLIMRQVGSLVRPGHSDYQEASRRQARFRRLMRGDRSRRKVPCKATCPAFSQTLPKPATSGAPACRSCQVLDTALTTSTARHSPATHAHPSDRMSASTRRFLGC